METYLYDDLYRQEETHWWHIAKRELMTGLIRRFIKGDRLKFLDVGCGTGKNIEALGQFGRVWGIDTSSVALKFCHKRNLTQVSLATGEKTKFARSTFDAVTLLDVLEHTDDVKTLREIKRILKPRGHLVLTVPAYQWLWGRWDEVLHHKRRYTLNSLAQLLKSQGFNPIYISYVYTFLLIPVYIIRCFKSLRKHTYYASDFDLTTPTINRILLKLARGEQYLMRWGRLPFGTSIVCVAQ